MIVELSKIDINDFEAVRLILNRIEITLKDIDQLVEVLVQTSNMLVANDIGFRLKDYEDSRILKALIQVINRPESFSKRAKLIYCCNAYDCSGYFDLFMQIVLDEVGESRINAIDVIGEMKGPFSDDRLLKAIKEIDNHHYLDNDGDSLLFLKKLRKHLNMLVSQP